jgi:hypothetical protein
MSYGAQTPSTSSLRGRFFPSAECGNQAHAIAVVNQRHTARCTAAHASLHGRKACVHPHVLYPETLRLLYVFASHKTDAAVGLLGLVTCASFWRCLAGLVTLVFFALRFVAVVSNRLLDDEKASPHVEHWVSNGHSPLRTRM